MTERLLITKTQRLPRRVAGNVALDLANTMSWRGTAQEVDHLGDAEAIVAWATDAGIVSDKFSVPASNRAMLVAKIHRLRHAIDAVGRRFGFDEPITHSGDDGWNRMNTREYHRRANTAPVRRGARHSKGTHVCCGDDRVTASDCDLWRWR